MLKTKSNLGKLTKKLEKAQKQAEKKGRDIVARGAATADKQARQNLKRQGRDRAPLLSDATQIIYGVTGEPDGSGITNHLTLEYRKRGAQYIAVLGIPKGEPSMIAKVQDQGAIIPVTEAMRGYFGAVYGINFKRETTHIQIPGRRFFQEAIKKASGQVKKELSNFMKEVFK